MHKCIDVLRINATYFSCPLVCVCVGVRACVCVPNLRFYQAFSQFNYRTFYLYSLYKWCDKNSKQGARELTNLIAGL